MTKGEFDLILVEYVKTEQAKFEAEEVADKARAAHKEALQRLTCAIIAHPELVTKPC